MEEGAPLPVDFYERDPSDVALQLLGVLIARRLEGKVMLCRIVEVEAYYGPWDPASRAAKHRRGRIVERLRGPVGLTLVYGIHRQWLVNIVAHEPGGWGAVLLRACEPVEGIPPDKPPKGPGRLTRALRIDKSLDCVPVYDAGSPLQIIGPPGPPEGREVSRSHRIGVTRDLDVPLRFCLADSRYLSVPC